MDLNTSFRAAYRTYLARPSGILPFYFLGSAVPAIARTLPILAVLIVAAAVYRSGELTEVRELLLDIGPLAYEELTDPAAGPPVTDDLPTVIADIALRPTVVGPLLLAAAIAVVIFVVANAAVTAGQIHGVVNTAGGTTDLSSGVAGIRQHTVTFLGLFVLEILLYLLIVGGVTVVIAAFAGIATPLAVLFGAVGSLFMLLAIPAIRLVFAFAPVVAVVDGVGLRGAVGGAIGFAVDRPGAVLGYGGLFLLAAVGVGTLSLILAGIGAEVITGLVVLLVVGPIFDTFKAILYGGQAVYTPIETSPSVQRTLIDGLRSGLDELLVFTRNNGKLVLLSGGIFAVSGYSGWVAGGFFDGILTTSIERRLAGTMPLGDFLFYAGNNWQVAYSQAFAGFGLAIPTVVALLTNGLLLGWVFRLEITPELLVAFLVPHGIIEIPGLLIAGALGLYLGGVAWKRLRGQAPAAVLVEAFSRAYRITIGLVVVFVVAAFMEAFISPYYWRFLGI